MKVNFVSLWVVRMIGPLAASLILNVAQAQTSRCTVSGTVTRTNINPLQPRGNPDTLACINPSAAYWVEGTGFPNASTVGRNTLFTNGTNNFDLTLFKSFAIRERRRLEFRWEVLNAFNHPQFVQMPGALRNVVNTLPGRFLNRDYTDSGIRSMWVQMKVIF